MQTTLMLSFLRACKQLRDQALPAATARLVMENVEGMGLLSTA